MTIVTAIVSPMARPSARKQAAMMPGRHKGSTTPDRLPARRAERERASRCDRGTACITSKLSGRDVRQDHRREHQPGRENPLPGRDIRQPERVEEWGQPLPRQELDAPEAEDDARDRSQQFEQERAGLADPAASQFGEVRGRTDAQRHRDQHREREVTTVP